MMSSSLRARATKQKSVFFDVFFSFFFFFFFENFFNFFFKKNLIKIVTPKKKNLINTSKATF